MMLSVSRSASKRVHFWLIENFLSPQFKALSSFSPFIHRISSLRSANTSVTTSPTSPTNGLVGSIPKPRNSALFGPTKSFSSTLSSLSVSKKSLFFSLSSLQIIYVDADQVSRVDLSELWELDIHDCVYAYTPLCTSNPDTKGFMVVPAKESSGLVLDAGILEGTSAGKAVSRQRTL